MSPNPIFAAVLAALLGHASAANFMATCSEIKLQGENFLFLTCDKGDDCMDSLEMEDVVTYSTLDLGRCYTNNDGKLSLGDGDPYWRSCRGCTLEPESAWMNCECQHDDTWSRSRVDLNEGLSNWEGSLCCGQGKCSTGVNNVAVPDMELKVHD